MNLLIVKLGALGDVLRTTPLLEALRRVNPEARITWVVDRANREALLGNPRIDRVLDFSPQTLERLGSERFDLAVNLDKDEEALQAMDRAQAVRKRGFGRAPDGTVAALDASSAYAVRLGQDDELKFRLNRKTYQEICFEQLDLRFSGEEYSFEIGESPRAEALRHLEALGAVRKKGTPWVGLNTGSGKRFAGKRLPEETLLKLVHLFRERLGATVLLLGGRDEAERNRALSERSRGAAINTGSHPIRFFAGMVSACDAVVSGDTTAMHVAIAARVPVVAYFGSTCAAEIELYGRGRKVVSTLDCAPCYKRDCPILEKCMTDLDPETLYAALRETLEESRHAAAR